MHLKVLLVKSLFTRYVLYYMVFLLGANTSKSFSYLI